MKFIVVEDDSKTQKLVRDILLKETFNRSDISILMFDKYNEKLEQIINNLDEPKVYILDIELMGEISGIEIGRRIRDVEWKSHIIFMTNHDKMFEKVYRDVLEIFDFIEKFHNFSSRLKEDISLILSKEYDNELFSYSNRYLDLNIYLKEITYIETYERKLVIHTTNNKFIINMSLNEILEKLDSRFIRTHKSCVANKTRIRKKDWTNKCFVLDTNEKVYLLSRTFKKGVDKNVARVV